MFLSSLVASAFCCLPGYSTDQAVILKQWSKVTGSTKMTASKLGVRLEIFQSHLIVLSVPPEWKATLMSPETKRYCQVPAANWRSAIASGAAFLRPGDPSTMHVVSTTVEKYQNLDCNKQLLKNNTEKADGGERHLNAWQKLLVKDGTLYTLRQPQYPPAVGKIFCRSYGAPFGDGLPVALTCRNKGMESSDEIKLDSVEMKPVVPGDYVIPKNYQSVAKVDDVTVCEALNKEFAEFMH